MRETVLLYNIDDKKARSAIQLIAVQMKVRVRAVSPSQYRMPLGLLAFGQADDQKEYLTLRVLMMPCWCLPDSLAEGLMSFCLRWQKNGCRKLI